MSKSNKFFDINLEEEERRIEEEMERGEWVPIENEKKMIKLITKAAREKSEMIEINKEDLKAIEKREGRKYKDVLGILIHKFATGEIRI